MSKNDENVEKLPEEISFGRNEKAFTRRLSTVFEASTGREQLIARRILIRDNELHPIRNKIFLALSVTEFARALKSHQ